MTAPRDRIWVDSQAVGGRRRAGEIVEILGPPEHTRYRVRWEDGHETIVYPGSDAAVSLSGKRRERPPAAAALRRSRGPRPAPRTPAPAGFRAGPGDRLVIRPHRLGEPQRDAEILEALGADGRPPFRVRWEDTGAESLFFPGGDALVEHLAASEAARPEGAARRRRTG